MRRRSSIRWRLTALYGLLFALCGLLMLMVSYRYVSSGLSTSADVSTRRAVDRYGYDADQVRTFYGTKVPPAPKRPQVDTVGEAIAGVQDQIRSDVLHDLLMGSGIALVLLLGAAVGVGWAASGRALRPVHRLTARARSLSDENLHERLAVDGPADELKELADTLDGMLERLDRAFEAQRRFSANVSHELRTPLSVIRAEAELSAARPDAGDEERRLAGVVGDAAQRAEVLLDSLLALARSQSTLRDAEVHDLADLAGDVLAERATAATRAGVELHLDVAAAPVQGDPWLLERLVANLVDNGIRHNQPGGWLDVEVTAVDGAARLRVRNTGPMVGEQDLAAILEPFRRADRSRPGYGLGMTIVQAVAEAHGGALDVRARPEGGLEVTLGLPLAADLTPA